ncbi:MAG: sulfotransferase [Herpetosiphonaceae bacterium]|nr:sulfotransferase [Herpetosiphonaceae bacterium]
MGAQRLTIAAKVRNYPTEIANLNHFQYSEGESIDARVIVEELVVSLYCLDHANQRAIFVETPPDIDLAQVPFYYQAQYEAALGLIAVSYETLHQLANDVVLDPQRMILLYSVGRCGSTLVSRALSQADGIANFSEPDVFTQLSVGRAADGSNDAEVSSLTRDCIKIMCAATRSGGATAWSFKFRSVGVELGDILYHNFPEAKVVFLYRHADGWAKSAARAYRIYDRGGSSGQPRNQQMYARLNPAIRTYMATHRPVSPVEILGSMWVSRIERCLELQRQGVPMLCVRYEDLQAAPQEVLDAMFTYCDLTVHDAAKLDRVVAQDSQAGTSLSQATLQESTKTLQEDDLVELHRLIQQFSPALTPTLVVPHTFRPA